MSKSNVAYLNEALSANDWGDPHGRQVSMLNMISAADWLADKCAELDRQNEELRKRLVPQRLCTKTPSQHTMKGDSGRRATSYTPANDDKADELSKQKKGEEKFRTQTLRHFQRRY